MIRQAVTWTVTDSGIAGSVTLKLLRLINQPEYVSVGVRATSIFPFAWRRRGQLETTETRWRWTRAGGGYIFDREIFS